MLSGTGKNWKTLKKINRIWKIYQNVRTTPAVMRNGTVILLYSKALKHSASSDTRQYQSHSQNVVSVTGKHQKSLKDIDRIVKSYQNIRITPPILENGTFILIFQNPKSLHWGWHTLILFKKSQFRSLELGIIKGLWKKLTEPEKIPKCQNNPCNNKKLDFHCTIFQGPKSPHLERNTLNLFKEPQLVSRTGEH